MKNIKQYIVLFVIMVFAVNANAQRRTNVFSTGLTTGPQVVNFDANDYGVTSMSCANASGGDIVLRIDYQLQTDRTISIPTGFILNLSYGSDRIKLVEVTAAGAGEFWIMGNQDNKGTDGSEASMSIVPISSGGGASGGDASAANQTTANTLLTAIRDSITRTNVLITGTNTRIDETNTNLTTLNTEVTDQGTTLDAIETELTDQGTVLDDISTNTTDLLAKPSISVITEKVCIRTALDTAQVNRRVVFNQVSTVVISDDLYDMDGNLVPPANYIATVECPSPESDVTIKGKAIIEDVYRFAGTAAGAATPLNTGGLPGNTLSLGPGAYVAYSCKWSPQTSVDPGDGSVASVTINGASYFPTETGLYKSVLKSVSAGPNNTTASPLNVSATGQGFCECTILK